MKTIQYFTYLKTILLIAPASLYFSNAATMHAGEKSRWVIGLVGARHPQYPGELPQGFLMVYSATERVEDGGLEYYAHSSYAIYTVDGKLFKCVENHISATDEVPQIVPLPTGSYIVEARSERDGYIRRLVTIDAGRRTILDADRN